MVVSADRIGGAARPQGLAKDRRVRRRAEFQGVFERGSRVHGRFFTILVLPNGRSSSRLGIVASRKFGGAVQRNRAKRLIREMFRKMLPTRRGPALDLVVIPRRELLDTPFPALTRDFQNVWQRGIDRVSGSRPQ
jgi:ribonuclease P protein component